MSTYFRFGRCVRLAEVETYLSAFNAIFVKYSEERLLPRFSFCLLMANSMRTGVIHSCYHPLLLPSDISQ